MPSPRFTPCATRLERAGDLPIVQDGGGDADRLHQRHAVGDQRRHGAREPRRLGFAQRVAQQRNLQPAAYPTTAGPRRCAM